MSEKETQSNIRWLWLIAWVVAICMNLHSCRMAKIEQSLKALEAIHPAEETK